MIASHSQLQVDALYVTLQVHICVELFGTIRAVVIPKSNNLLRLGHFIEQKF